MFQMRSTLNEKDLNYEQISTVLTSRPHLLPCNLIWPFLAAVFVIIIKLHQSPVSWDVYIILSTPCRLVLNSNHTQRIIEHMFYFIRPGFLLCCVCPCSTVLFHNDEVDVELIFNRDTNVWIQTVFVSGTWTRTHVWTCLRQGPLVVIVAPLGFNCTPLSRVFILLSLTSRFLSLKG